MTSNDTGTPEAVDHEYFDSTWDLIKCGTPSIYRSTRPGRNHLYALDFGGSGKIVYSRPDLLHFGRSMERLAKTGRA